MAKSTSLLLIAAVVSVLLVMSVDSRPMEQENLVLPEPPVCKEGETVNPLTGTCMFIPTFYVENYPRDCPMDVGCLPISQRPAV